jgi:hypothetical protein
MAKQPKPKQPKKPPADDGDRDDEGKGGDGPLSILDEGIADREAGRQPSAEALAYARENAGPATLTQWNKSPGGSQNVGPMARAVMGDWRWLVQLALKWKEGLFGREIGANSIDYVITVLRSLLVGRRLALVAGYYPGAEAIRIAVRAAIGYFALCSVPVPRRHSTWLSTDHRFPGTTATHPRPESPTAAAAGMRWAIRRGGKDGDAASVVIRGALADPQRWGLTHDEADLVARIVVEGDRSAAREIGRRVNEGGWLFGTLPGWHFRARRTSEGVEVVNDSEYPNGNTKMVCSVCIVRLDGTWVSVRAWPEGYQVIDDGEQIVTRSLGQHGQPAEPGEVTVQRLGGEELWRLDLHGSEIAMEVA